MIAFAECKHNTPTSGEEILCLQHLQNLRDNILLAKLNYNLALTRYYLRYPERVPKQPWWKRAMDRIRRR